MPIINVKVENKIAQAEKGAYIVCGNSDYIINFELGEEWSGHNFKTALFVYNGKLQPVVFEGNSCAVPVLYNTTLVAVGLQSKDKTLITTTPSYIRCEISAEDLGGEIEAPAQDVYDEIIALLNKYITEGGGASSGGLTEEQVKEIVSEEIADLQTKTDESLETESKTVVGSINELNNKNNSLSKEIAIANAIIEQSGIVSKYKATIEDAYSERVTADGANVLDGSKAKLEKVVGNTVKSQNLFDGTLIKGYYGDADFSIEGKTSEIYRSLKINLPAGTYKIQFSIETQLMRKIANGVYGANPGAVFTTNGGDVGFSFRALDSTAWKDEYLVWITEGESDKPYTPYFVGLKSASFAGIESTNADGTETATLDFPKTETPLGVTIDFENKKITDYGVEIVLTGEENISCRSPFGYNNGTGIYIAGVANGDIVSSGYGISTESKYPIKKSWATNSICIVSGTDIYWDKIVADLGFEDNGETDAEKLQKIRSYLAQRYADGNPVTIRYVSSTLQSETPFTADNEYTAYKGGTEKVLDNDGKDYGAENTLSQNYIIVTEVK